jgi:hypothetical protein
LNGTAKTTMAIDLHIPAYSFAWSCTCLPLQSISTAWPESKTVLEKLRSELDASLDKLTTRERFLNDQFERLMSQYRAARQQLTGVQVCQGASCRHATTWMNAAHGSVHVHGRHPGTSVALVALDSVYHVRNGQLVGQLSMTAGN